MIENNVSLTGDEARLIMSAMTSEGTMYPGPSLPVVTNLLIKLQSISNVQPPVEDESND